LDIEIIDPQPTRELQTFDRFGPGWKDWMCRAAYSQDPNFHQLARQCCHPMFSPRGDTAGAMKAQTLHPIISTKIRPGKILAFNLKV